MKLFSRASEYAILSMMNVIERGSLDGFSTREVCAASGIPEAFARKVLVALAKAHILSGTPGPGGGYRLVRQPAEVTLLDIVLAIDGENAFDECPLGVTCNGDHMSRSSAVCATCQLAEPNCGLNHLCPMHGLWHEAKDLVVGRLRSTTLENIRERMKGTPEKACENENQRPLDRTINRSAGVDPGR